METTITPPPNEIYSFLRDNKLTDKSENDFLKEYENPEKAKELHDFFIKNKLTTKNYDEFYDQYLKKKDSELPPEDGSSGGENSASSLLGSSLNPNNPNPVLQGLPNLRPQEPVEPAKEDKRKYIEKGGKYFLDNGDGKLNPITKITYDFGVKNATKKSFEKSVEAGVLNKPDATKLIASLNEEKDAISQQLQKAAEAYMFWEDAHKKMGEDFLKSQSTDPSNYLQAGKEKDKYLKTVQELERKKIDIQEKVSGLGVEWGIAPELLISKLEKPKETSYFQGTWKAFDQSGIGVVKSLEGALQLLEDAGTFIKTGGKGGIGGAKSSKPKLSDVMTENNKVWLDAPDNILGKTVSGLGSMTYDLVLTGLAPGIKHALLSKATGGGITQVPKFGTYMGAKGFGSGYAEDRDLMKAIEGGIMGFEDGVLMHSLGYTGHQIGNVLANAKKSPFLNKLAGATATSLIFGAHAGYESYLHEGKINWDDVGVGFGTGVAFGIIPIIKATRDRAVTNFMTTPNKTISTIIQEGKSAQELRETSIDLIEKAGEEAPGEKKQAAQLAAVISTTAADLKAIGDEVLSNPQAFKDQIDATENLSAIEKQFYKDKIDRFVSENDERVIAAKPYLDEVKRLEGEAVNVEAQNIDANVKELNKKAIETSIKEMKKAAEDAFMKAAEKKSENKEEKKPEEKKPEEKPADKPKEDKEEKPAKPKEKEGEEKGEGKKNEEKEESVEKPKEELAKEIERTANILRAIKSILNINIPFDILTKHGGRYQTGKDVSDQLSEAYHKAKDGDGSWSLGKIENADNKGLVEAVEKIISEHKPKENKIEKQWAEMAGVDRLKYVPSELVDKYDLPEYSDMKEWDWENLPDEIRTEITDRLEGKETEIQKKEKAEADKKKKKAEAKKAYEKAKEEFDNMDTAEMDLMQVQDMLDYVEKLKQEYIKLGGEVAEPKDIKFTADMIPDLSSIKNPEHRKVIEEFFANLVKIGDYQKDKTIWQNAVAGRVDVESIITGKNPNGSKVSAKDIEALVEGLKTANEAFDEFINNPPVEKIEGEKKPKEEAPSTPPKNKKAIVGEWNEKFKDANKVFGEVTTIEMPDGETREAQYMVVEMDDIIASHNENSFENSKGYPSENGESVNPRNYKSDAVAKNDVIANARDLKPSIVISDSATPDSGTPIISEDGVVLSGNGRTMSIKLSRTQFQDKYEAYKQALIAKAKKFDLDADAISKMKNPILVKVDKTVKEYTVKGLDQYNQKAQKGESSTDKMIKRSAMINADKILKDKIFAIISRHETMSDLWADKNSTNELKGHLLQSGVILEHELSEYYENKQFTEIGKDLVEDILIAGILKPETIRATNIDGVKSFRKNLLKSIPALSKNFGLGEFSIEKELNEAILLQSKFKQAGKKDDEFWDYLRQNGLFETVDGNVISLNRMINSGPINFKNMVEKFNKAAEGNIGGFSFEEDLSMTKEEIIEAINNKNLSKDEKELLEQIIAANEAIEQDRPKGDDNRIQGGEKPKPEIQEGPRARPGEPLDQGGGGKGNAGRRPTIVKANAEFIPKPKYELPKDEYTMLDDEQRLGVQLAMDRFISGAKGFINADGTGVGKTMQQIVIAKEYQKHFKKPVVIITENENIIDNNFKGDAKLLGVDISDIEFGTYTQLGKGKVAQGKYGLVIFDEAHNLKNAETAKASEAANIKTDQKLFVTATPMDKVPGAIYFVKETTNLTESQIIDKLGFSILEERDPQTGKITYKAVIKEGTNPADINRNVAKLSQEMTQEGAMIRREYPFFGEISESKIELTEEQADEQSEILDYWEDQLEEAKNENGGISPAAAMSIGGQRSGELSRWNESNKLSLAYKKTVDNIKAGRKVVIIAEGVNPSFIKGLNREVPGIITELVKKLEAAGYKVGKIYGGDQAKNKEANDKFQAGELDVVIGTPKSASTGRNLDDSVGNAPRTLLMVTANYSGEQFQQILGRVSRRNTKTPAKIEILYNNSAIDLRRMEIVSNKLRTLKAIQEGRIDEVDIGIEDVGENKKPDVAYGDITIVQYSEKSILVKGVPKSLAPMIKTLGRGGKWNWKLAGWIFSNDSRPAVEAFLERMNKKEDGEGGPVQSKGVEGKISDFEKRPPVKPSEPFKLFDRVYELVKKYAPNSKLLQGYQGKNALGSFHTLTKNLRLKGLNDIAVAFHEITHALDDAQGLIKNLPTDLKKRLYDVYLQYYPDAKPTHSAYLKSTEGYAMLMQKYVESPSLIEAEYPELVAELIKGKHAFKEMDEFLIDASNLISDYQNLEPMDKLGARMVNEIKKDARKIAEKAKSFKDRLEEEIFDDLQALEEMDNKTGTLFTADDVTSQIRMARNSDMYATNNLDGKKYLALNKAGEYVEKHNFTWKTISDQIIDKVGSDGIERVGEYMYAREVKSWYDAVNKLNAEIEALDNKIAGETDQAIIDVLNAERLGKMKKRQEIVSIINNEGVSEMEANEAYDKGKEMFSFIEDKINTLMREQILLLANDNVRIIDNDQKKQYLSRNGEYAPLKRAWYNEVIGDVSDESMHLKPVSGGMGSLKKRYGSKKPVINPFLSAMANEAVFTRKAHEAMVKNKIYDNVMKYPAEMGNYFEPIALTAIPGKQGIKGFAESSDPTVLIAKDRAGTTKGLKILDPAVARVLSEEFSYKDIPIVLKAMVEASRLFKIGTTGWFPPFLVANTTLDAVSRFTNTRTGLIPFASEASELTKALNNKNSMERKYWREYLYLAGKTQTRMGWNKVAVNEGSIGKIEKRRRVAMLANGMSNISDFLSAPSNISEVLPRATEYIRARKQGKTQAVALELAGRVTGPFHHKGRMTGVGGQAWVKAVPYMNPILQVLDVTMERLKTKEGAERYVAASAMLGAAAGATIYTVMNVWSDEEREKAMNELKGKSPQELAMYLYLPHPYKRGEFLKIRTPETHSYISLGVNMYFLEKYAQANYTKGEMFDAATTPIPDQLQPWKGLKWLMSVTPNMVRNPLEIGFNTQTFPTVRPIESEYERRNMLPENRYNAYTSDFAKYLAKTDLGRDLKLSPKMIDHFIKGNLGRATGYITGKPGMFNLEKIFVSEMYLESTRQARQFFEKTKLYEQYVHDAKAEIRKATGASGLSNYEMLSVYDEYVKGVPIDKKQMEEVVNYLEQGELIEEKFAELKNLDPDTDQKGFEQLSNEIMQDMINLNDKGKVE